MKWSAIILSYAALFVLVLSSILFLAKQVGQGQMKTVMLITTIVWFTAAPIWILRDKQKNF